MRRLLGLVLPAALACCACFAAAASAQTTSEGAGVRVAEAVSPSVVLVLAGTGAGRLDRVGTGVVVRADGVLLTAYHVVKDAREVQRDERVVLFNTGAGVKYLESFGGGPV